MPRRKRSVEFKTSGASFVFEPIIVDPSSMQAAGLARGGPVCPMRFVWRGQEYRVTEVLETGRQLRAHDSSETYVRSHSFRVVTECGHEMVLRCDRQVRGNPWRLYTVKKLHGDGDANLGSHSPG